jgi:NAD(P)H-flavin reductase
MNPYIPVAARIESVKKETPDVRTFRFSTGKKIKFRPGQVIMVTVFGFGESTFGIIPTEKEKFYEFSAKKTGTVTDELFKMKKGGYIGIRGPFGNGYPLEEMKGKNIVLVAGGIGFPPVKSLLLSLLKERKKYGKIVLCYGSRSPEELVYRKELEEWNKNVEVRVTVDKGNVGWKGNVGVVTTILGGLEKNSLAFICGPPVMMKFVSQKLLENGLKEKQIYASMERLMQCGTGMCGHCNLGKVYVCRHGPVFRLDEMERLTEKTW